MCYALGEWPLPLPPPPPLGRRHLQRRPLTCLPALPADPSLLQEIIIGGAVVAAVASSLLLANRVRAGGLLAGTGGRQTPCSLARPCRVAWLLLLLLLLPLLLPLPPSQLPPLPLPLLPL